MPEAVDQPTLTQRESRFLKHKIDRIITRIVPQLQITITAANHMRHGTKEGIEPVGAIYFTDMECNRFPDKEPSYPVIWVKYGQD